MEGLLGFVLAACALAGSPGPATLSLAATGAAFGARRGLAYMSGIIAGLIIVMAVTATGVIGILLAVPGVTSIVVGLSAAYFAYLAIRIATAPPLADQAAEARQPSFAGGIFLSLVNPKGYAAMAAMFSGFVLIRQHLGLDIAAKMTVLTVIVTTSSVSWLIAGAGLTRFFREPRTNRVINVTFAILLVGSVAFALLY